MKKLIESKTFWLATIQMIVGIAAAVGTNYPGIGEVLMIKSIGDIVLRMMTTMPIE